MNQVQKFASVVASVFRTSSLLVCSTILFSMTGSQANSHWPHGHHWGVSSWGFGPSFGYSSFGGSTWGAYGMGGGFRHASFIAPVHSVRTVGFGCSPIFFNPVVCNPIVYRPVFCSPIYYQPIHFQPIQYCPPPVTPIVFQTGFPCCSVTSRLVTPRLSVPTNIGQGLMLQVSNNPRAIQLASAAPRVAYKPSNAWTTEAISLIDEMAKQGGAAEGYAAAKQLLKSHNELPGHFYTRLAILSALNDADSSEVLRYLELAKTNHADSSGADLPGGSIRSFVAKIPSGSMDKLLNTIAAKALKKQTDRKPDFKVLANLLVMDGQSDRASRFQAASESSTRDIADTDSNEPTSSSDTQALAMAK